MQRDLRARRENERSNSVVRVFYNTQVGAGTWPLHVVDAERRGVDGGHRIEERVYLRSLFGKGGSVLLDGVAHRVVERFDGVWSAHDSLFCPGAESLEGIRESGHSSGIVLLGNVIRVLSPELCACLRQRSRAQRTLCAVQLEQLCSLRQRRLQGIKPSLAILSVLKLS